MIVTISGSSKYGAEGLRIGAGESRDMIQLPASLVPSSSCTIGAPGASASLMSVTAGRGSQSTCTSSAASLAWARVSATTTATGSPT